MAEILSRSPLNTVNNGKVSYDDQPVKLFFSASWCNPCKAAASSLLAQTTPVILVCLDEERVAFQKYVREHPQWLYLDFADPRIKELAREYGVTAIPTIVDVVGS